MRKFYYALLLLGVSTTLWCQERVQQTKQIFTSNMVGLPDLIKVNAGETVKLRTNISLPKKTTTFGKLLKVIGISTATYQTGQYLGGSAKRSEVSAGNAGILIPVGIGTYLIGDRLLPKKADAVTFVFLHYNTNMQLLSEEKAPVNNDLIKKGEAFQFSRLIPEDGFVKLIFISRKGILTSEQTNMILAIERDNPTQPVLEQPEIGHLPDSYRPAGADVIVSHSPGKVLVGSSTPEYLEASPLILKNISRITPAPALKSSKHNISLLAKKAPDPADYNDARIVGKAIPAPSKKSRGNAPVHPVNTPTAPYQSTPFLAPSIFKLPGKRRRGGYDSDEPIISDQPSRTLLSYGGDYYDYFGWGWGGDWGGWSDGGYGNSWDWGWGWDWDGGYDDGFGFWNGYSWSNTGPDLPPFVGDPVHARQPISYYDDFNNVYTWWFDDTNSGGGGAAAAAASGQIQYVPAPCPPPYQNAVVYTAQGLNLESDPVNNNTTKITMPDGHQVDAPMPSIITYDPRGAGQATTDPKYQRFDYMIASFVALFNYELAHGNLDLWWDNGSTTGLQLSHSQITTIPPLDPTLVKAMIMQETEMGTLSGQNGYFDIMQVNNTVNNNQDWSDNLVHYGLTKGVVPDPAASVWGGILNLATKGFRDANGNLSSTFLGWDKAAMNYNGGGASNYDNIFTMMKDYTRTPAPATDYKFKNCP